MNHLRKFIDLDAFQNLGEFRPVSGEESSSKRQSGGSLSETPVETQSYDFPDDQSSRARKRRRTGHEADSVCSASDTPTSVTSIQGNISISETSPSCELVEYHLTTADLLRFWKEPLLYRRNIDRFSATPAFQK